MTHRKKDTMISLSGLTHVYKITLIFILKLIILINTYSAMQHVM